MSNNFSKQEFLDKNKILGQKIHQLEKIQHETAVYKQALDRVPVMLIILQNDKICYVNAAFESILGFKKKEIVHMNWEKLIHPDDRALVSSGYKNAMENRNGSYQYEMKLLSKDTETVWVDLCYNIIDTSGQTFVVISAYDISRSKYTKEAFQLSEARYRAIVEDQAELVGRASVNNQLTFVNEAFCNYIGKSREEIIGTNCMAYTYEQDSKIIQDIRDSVSRENPVTINEERMVKADGGIGWVEWTTRAIFNEKGRFIESQSVGRDITGRKRAQEELKKAKDELELRVVKRTAELSKANQDLLLLNSNLNNIVKNMSDGVFIVDKSGDIQILNGVLEGIWGDLVGEVQIWIKNDILYKHKSFLYKMLQEGKPFRDEEIILSGKKGDLHCLASGTPIKNEQGEVNSGFIMVRPIKEIRRLINRFTGAKANFYFSDIISDDSQFHKIIDTAMIATANLSNVLIEGESGTGKEMFAQAIHNESSHRSGPFIAVNCGAIPRELVGSELFGYADGAFTGAKKGGNTGKFELASGGTIFLDEIADMPIDQQVALLRVIQEKKITRIGGHQLIPIDVRIICASNKNLLEEISKGNFRQDLYYRLNVISFNIPPLRERKDDIPLLFRYFISKYTGKDITVISPEILNCLMQYNWPGNVRELQNVAERMIHMANGAELLPEHLPLEISNYDSQKENSPDEYISIARSNGKENTRNLMAKIERDKIIQLLNLHDGKVNRVAQEMGLSRRTIYRKIKQYEIKH